MNGELNEMYLWECLYKHKVFSIKEINEKRHNQRIHMTYVTVDNREFSFSFNLVYLYTCKIKFNFWIIRL